MAKSSLTTTDDPNSNEAVRNLVLDHASSMIFQRNYLSRMIRYDTQAVYRGTASRGNLIVASHRMSRMIDPRRPRKLPPHQPQELQRDARIQELRGRQQNLFQQIRDQFTFVYRAKGQPIHDEYEQIERDIDCIVKERKRALKSQLQAEYDAAAPMQDMLALMAVDEAAPSPVQPPPAPIEYAFEERARIAQTLFDPPQSAKPDGNLERQIAIVDDLISLCTRRERRPRKSRRSWEDKMVINSSDDHVSDTAIQSECSDTDTSVTDQAPLRCLCCLGDTTLPQSERQHVFGSKYSLQRHFNRYHAFRPGQNCPFPDDEYAELALENLMEFKNHAARVHRIFMPDKC